MMIRPTLESLDDRYVPATITLSGGVIDVVGTDATEKITLDWYQGWPWHYTYDAVQVNVYELQGFNWVLVNHLQALKFTSYDTFEVHANGGNDTVYDMLGGASNDTNHLRHMEDYFWGGDGNDTLIGGLYGGEVHGGAGNDNLYGYWGNDWTRGIEYSRDRGNLSGTDDLTRDFAFVGSAGGKFAVDIPNGTYDVTVVSGDATSPHRSEGFNIEGTSFTLSPLAGQYARKTVRVTVEDGKLDLSMYLAWYTDPTAVLNALEVRDTDGNLVKAFDFGTDSSPVAPGYTRVSETTLYTHAVNSEAQGYGWYIQPRLWDGGDGADYIYLLGVWTGQPEGRDLVVSDSADTITGFDDSLDEMI